MTRLLPDQAKRCSLSVTLYLKRLRNIPHVNHNRLLRFLSDTLFPFSPPLISRRFRRDLFFMSPGRLLLLSQLRLVLLLTLFLFQHHIQFCSDERRDLFKSGELTGSAL